MKLRWWKIGLLAGPFLLLAGLIVIGAIIWAMRAQFWNTVQFNRSVGDVSVQDKEAIRRVVLNEDIIKNVPHPLLRYTVDIFQHNETNGVVTYGGVIKPNRPLVGDGYIVVSQRNGGWEVTSLILAQ